MTIPTITIVIPCFNQEDYLIGCLNSLFSQSFINWEAIIIDDSSSRGDLENAISKLSDPRLTLIRHETNRGVGAARNTGFRNARSNLILPLDIDDLLTPFFLEITLTEIMGHPEVNCVFTDFQLFGTSNDIWHYPIKEDKDILVSQWIPGPGTLMRKQLWESTGGYSEDPILRYGNEDWDFWIAAVKSGINAIHIPKPLYLYRRRPDSRSVTTEKYYDSIIREFIYHRHQKFFDQYQRGNEFLANGYQNSAYSAWKSNEPLRTVILASRAWALSPKRLHLIKLIAHVIVITPLLNLVNKIKCVLKQK